jgi:hypothetical protein
MEELAARNPELRDIASGFLNIGLHNSLSGRVLLVPSNLLPASIFEGLRVDWPNDVDHIGFG